MKPEWIVIHHSATRDSGTVSWDAIKRYHMEVNGWQDIGYHYGVELVGDSYVVLFGRQPTVAGAHSKELNFNNKSLGVCLVGNFDEAPPPAEQLKAAAWIVKILMRTFGIPVERVIGHRDVGLMAGFDWKLGPQVYKSCPGSQFLMPAFLKMLAS